MKNHCPDYDGTKLYIRYVFCLCFLLAHVKLTDEQTCCNDQSFEVWLISKYFNGVCNQNMPQVKNGVPSEMKIEDNTKTAVIS